MELNEIDLVLLLEYIIVGVFTAGFFGYLVWKMGQNPDNHEK